MTETSIPAMDVSIVSIGGSFLSPTVSIDLSSGVANLTKQLIEIQKQKFINQGKDQIKDVIGGFLGGNY